MELLLRWYDLGEKHVHLWSNFAYKFSILKQQLLCSFCGSEFRVAGLGGSGSRSSMGWQSPWQLGLWSTESLPRAGRSDSKVALLQGCCGNSLLLVTWTHPWGLLEGPHDTAASFPQSEPRREGEQAGRTMAWPSFGSHTPSFYHRSESLVQPTFKGRKCSVRLWWEKYRGIYRHSLSQHTVSLRGHWYESRVLQQCSE